MAERTAFESVIYSRKTQTPVKDINNSEVYEFLERLGLADQFPLFEK